MAEIKNSMEGLEDKAEERDGQLSTMLLRFYHSIITKIVLLIIVLMLREINYRLL